MASARRLRSSVTSHLSLPEDALYIIFSFCDTQGIVRAARVCKFWLHVVDDRHLAWEAALFELDPLARLGPAGFVAAKRSGVGCLELARRLGCARCALCGKRGAPYFSIGAPWARVCDACPALSEAPCVLLYNRFVFARKGTPVATEAELRDAIDDANAAERDDMYGHTIVVTRDINLTGQLEVYRPLRLIGATPSITLTSVGGPVIMAMEGVIEDLILVSGMPFEELSFDDESANFPALELFISDVNPRPGGLVIRDCTIRATQGSALMCDSGRLSVSGCTIDSLCYFGLICKSTPTFEPPFLLSVRDTHFCGGSMWHISAGKDVSDDDEAALLAPNFFSNDGAEFISDTSENVTRHNSKWMGGVIQPWRRGAMK